MSGSMKVTFHDEESLSCFLPCVTELRPVAVSSCDDYISLEYPETILVLEFTVHFRSRFNKYYTDLELGRYIGNTHHRGRLWDNRKHRQMMTSTCRRFTMMLLTEFT